MNAVFYPCMTYNLDEQRGDNCYNCPVVAYYPELLAANVAELQNFDFMMPYFELTNHREFIKQAERFFCKKYPAVKKKQVAKAAEKAYAALEAYYVAIREEGRKAIAYADANGLEIAVVVGRPYHIDPEINHGINQLIASYGMVVVSEDAVWNLVENLVWSLMHEREGMQAMNQTTMGLLLRHLMHYTGRIRVNRDSEQSFEQQLTLQVLRYIDEHYREGSLTELAALMGYDVYWLSRAINRLLGRNYKELLQIKRLNQAAFLLHSTRMPVADVSFAVGYDNTSYFYRIFRTYYGMSPKEYRKNG